VPNTIIAVFSVEALLIVLTNLFLIKPAFLFRTENHRKSKVGRWGGLFFLCITFLWSVVVGMVMSLNEMSFSL
jgi:hypothetical protein